MSDAGNAGVEGADIMRMYGAQRPLALAALASAREMRRPPLARMLKRLMSRRAWLSRTPAWRGSAWAPLLLRWARKAAAAAGTGALRARALAARPGSEFHWHFYLTARPGAGRARGQALAVSVIRQFPAPATATWMYPSSTGRMEGTAYRWIGGPAGAIDGARALPVHPQLAAIGGVGSTARGLSVGSAAWMAAPAPESGRTRSKLRRLVRGAAHVRRLPGEGDRYLATLARAPAGQSFLTRAHPQPEAQSFDPIRAGGRNTSGAALPESASRSSRSSMGAGAAIPSTMRWGNVRMQARGDDFPQSRGWTTRSSFTRTLLRYRRDPAPARAFDLPRTPAAAVPPGEPAWRVGSPAAAAEHFPRHSSASLAIPASSGETPRFGMASSALAPSACSPPAASTAPMPPGRGADHAVVRATALDPALAERLADEVIRRIDQRARIERERRGL